MTAQYQAYAVDDRVYFAGTYRGPTLLQDAVAVTDGTIPGTQLLEDREPTIGGPSPTTFRKVANGVIYGLAGKLYLLPLDALACQGSPAIFSATRTRTGFVTRERPVNHALN